jgi:hypothetical protein
MMSDSCEYDNESYRGIDYFGLGEGPEVVNTVMNLISSGSMEFSCIM